MQGRSWRSSEKYRQGQKNPENRLLFFGFQCIIVVVPVYRSNIYPPVAKLDIAVDSDSKGRGFESLRAGQ